MKIEKKLIFQKFFEYGSRKFSEKHRNLPRIYQQIGAAYLQLAPATDVWRQAPISSAGVDGYWLAPGSYLRRRYFADLLSNF